MENNSSHKQTSPSQRRQEFLARKNVVDTASRKERLAKRFAPLVAAVALTGFMGANALNDHIQSENTITDSYSAEVKPGGSLIETANEIEEANNLNFNATEVGQNASADLNGAAAKPGDTLVVYTNADRDVVSEEVVTVAEKNANR